MDDSTEAQCDTKKERALLRTELGLVLAFPLPNHISHHYGVTAGD